MKKIRQTHDDIKSSIELNNIPWGNENENNR